MACPPGNIQIRRDLQGIWDSINPQLLSGEFGYATDTGVLKVGPGSWSTARIIGSQGSTGPQGPSGPVGPSIRFDGGDPDTPYTEGPVIDCGGVS